MASDTSHPPGVPAADRERVQTLVRELRSATAAQCSGGDMVPVHEFLHQVREALCMEVAFVSEFVAGQRVFTAVSLGDPQDAAVVQGGSDALLDTYCRLVAEGSLEPVVRSTADHPALAALPITQALRIGCYLSARVVLRSGAVFGTVCCFSSAPRADLQAVDAAALQAIAEAVAASVDHSGHIRAPIWRAG